MFMKGIFIAFLFWWDVRRWWCTSKSDSASVILTVRNLNPITETIPATLPMIIAMYGWIVMSAQVPTATPPARVAFWMCTCVEHRNRGKCTEQAESRRTERIQDPWTPQHILHFKGLLTLSKRVSFVITESLSSKQLRYAIFLARVSWWCMSDQVEWGPWEERCAEIEGVVVEGWECADQSFWQCFACWCSQGTHLWECRDIEMHTGKITACTSVTLEDGRELSVCVYQNSSEKSYSGCSDWGGKVIKTFKREPLSCTHSFSFSFFSVFLHESVCQELKCMYLALSDKITAFLSLLRLEEKSGCSEDASFAAIALAHRQGVQKTSLGDLKSCSILK